MASSVKATRKTDQHSPKHFKALIVEDSKTDAELLELQITNSGYELTALRVTSTAEMQQALASDEWDVIIADYAVPGFGAMAALEVLQQNGRDIPFIVVSGVITDETAVRAMRAGAHDYVLKDNLWRLVPAIEREMQEAITRWRKRELEELLHLQNAVLQSAANTIVITDREGTIEWVNPAFTTLTGYTPDEVIGQNPRLLNSGKHDARFFENMWNTILSGAVWREEITNRRKDGSLYFEDMTITPIRSADDSIGHFVAVKEDITKRKEQEQEIAHQASFPQLNPTAIVETDLTGNITYANPAMRTRFPDLFDRRESHPLLAGWRSILETLKTQSKESTSREVMVGAAAFLQSIHHLPTLGLMRFYCVDITERKRAEEALRESEQRVRAKLESILSPEGEIGDVDLADIIDTEGLQALFEHFYEVSGMPTAIIDLKGKVLVGVGWQDICTRFHRVNPESCQHCIESDVELSAEVPAGDYKLYKCKNHMWDVVTPIIVGGKHVGNVFSGQFFFEGDAPDIELFREQTKRFGFPETEYIAALERVPRLSQDQLASGMAFLMKLADMISKLGYSNLKLARSLAERDRLMSALTERDSTLREQADRMAQLATEAEEQKDRMDFALRAAGFGEWDFDLKTRNLTRSYRHDQIFGYGSPLPEFTYENLLEHVLPQDRAEVDRAFKIALSGERALDCETRIRRPDGTIKWIAAKARMTFDDDGKPAHMIGINMDVTERKEAEIALHAREQQLRTVLNAIPVGVVLCDASGKLVQANPAAHEIWGATLPLVKLKEYSTFKGRRPGQNRDLKAEEWALAQSLQKGDVVLGEEIEIEAFDGGRKTILNNALPIRDEHGAITGAVAVIIDITDKKQAEQALIRSEKLASVGRMAATIAHEVNNPLAAALNAVYLVSNDPACSDAARHHLQVAERELERVAHMTKQTLGFYKESATLPKAVRLTRILDEVLDLFEPRLKNNSISVARRYRSTGDVHAVEGEVRQVLSNLVVNSIDAMPRGGTLHVRTTGPSMVNGRPMIGIAIADTGEGIAPEHLKQIFEPFFTTRESVGTGLGLWVTEELLNKNNGRICVRSRLGRGTVSTIWLPLERRGQERTLIA